jgi:RES domain-containing protein
VKITAWRIVQAQHLASAFDGEGARQYPGRWNHRETPMVYTAGSLSLAALEMLVNLDAEQILNRYMAIPVTFDDQHCKRIAAHQLPTGWAGHPIVPVTRDLGSAWVHSRASPVLAVPSAVVPIETNFLLNPLHPEFSKIQIGSAEAFAYDPRLIKAQA